MGLYVLLDDKMPEPPSGRPPLPEPVAAVVFGSDRGLCGRFNEDLARFAVATMDGLKIAAQDRLILTVGARVEAHLEELKQPLQECFFVPGSVAAITQTVQDILLKLEAWRSSQGVTRMLLFYNRSSRSQGRQPTLLQLLPLDQARLRQLKAMPWPSRVLPTYSMDRTRLLSALIRQYLFVSLYRACAESLASEHGSRLASMQMAEKNIEERLLELDMAFRQRRQDAITEELLDLVAGFETLLPKSERHLG